MSKPEPKSLCYSGKLLVVNPGDVITISGKTKEYPEYFEIFLGSDKGTSADFDDVQFHVSVNCRTGEIVRNSYTKAIGWDVNQEREDNLLPNNSGKFTKKAGEFKFTIYADTNMFFLSLDDKPFCTYEYRKPLKDIRRINVFGDVERIHQVSHSSTLQEKSSDDTMFTGSMPTLKSETAVVVTAVPKGSEEGHFMICLSEASSGKSLLQVVSKFQNGEIIAVSEDENLNRNISEFPESFPFTIGEAFKAGIGITKQSFIFAVNGQHILRCPVDDNWFHNNPMNVRVTSCEGLEIDVQGVDVYELEGEQTISTMMLKEPYTSAADDKILARIFHH